jgi:BirA family biotin operon repressor/biotin-[acetyl-CoA-carboxylase] ligase
MLNELDKLYTDFLAHGFDPARQEWQQRCNASGRHVTVSEAGTEVVGGIFAGIDEDGALLVQTSNGRIERVLSGDVTVI